MGLHKYSGVGCVYAAPVNADGVKTGSFRRVGNAYPLTVQVKTKTIKEVSRMCDTAGQVLDSKTEIDEITGSLVLRQWNAGNLAWALMGTEVAQTTTGGTVSDEDVTAPTDGGYLQLAHRDVSAVTVTDKPETKTYVEDVDYRLNARLGLIQAIPGGDIAAGDELLVDYTYAARTGYKIDIGTRVLIKIAVLANLRNEFTDEKLDLEFYKVGIAPSKEINFISEPGSDGETLDFDIVMETPEGKSSPGTIDGISL